MVISAPIFSEYETVLRRDKFGIDPASLSQSLELIRDHALVVAPAQPVSASPDSADNRFWECAEAADADYLITRNTRHFPRRWKNAEIVNARQFLEQVGSTLQP
ncbi:MAG TPA: PIN domain-containing protein [Blastocatellia bacterium]